MDTLMYRRRSSYVLDLLQRFVLASLLESIVVLYQSLYPLKCLEKEFIYCVVQSFMVALVFVVVFQGPAHCFNRAHSIFRRDDSSEYLSLLPDRARGQARQDYLRVLLCVGAESEDPFQCASSGKSVYCIRFSSICMGRMCLRRIHICADVRLYCMDRCACL
jgi:hypothetical protein